MAREAPVRAADLQLALQMSAQAFRDWVVQTVPQMIEQVALTRREAPEVEGDIKGWVKDHVTKSLSGLREEIPESMTEALRAGVRDEVTQAMSEWMGQTVPEMIEQVALTKREAPAVESGLKVWVREHVHKSLEGLREDIPDVLTAGMRGEVKGEIDRAVALVESKLSETIRKAIEEVADRYQQTLEEIRNVLSSMPTPQITVPVPEVHVPAPQVNVNVPKQDIPAPQVNVNVPPLEQPRVEVQAPTVNFNTPKRKVKKTISYDQNGRPTEIIEEEGV